MQLYKDPPIINVSWVQFLTLMECTVSIPVMQDDSIWQIKNVDAIVIRETTNDEVKELRQENIRLKETLASADAGKDRTISQIDEKCD